MSALLTFAQFETLPDDGFRHELLQGQHIISPPTTIRQGSIRHAIHALVWPYVHQNRLGELFIAAGFLLSADTFLQPDACFIKATHLQRTEPDGYLEGSPAIAVEVASDANTAAQLDLKMDQYFAHGAEEVWIVYPETKKVRVHCPNGTSRTFSGSSTLQSGALPGLSISVSSLFEG